MEKQFLKFLKKFQYYISQLKSNIYTSKKKTSDLTNTKLLQKKLTKFFIQAHCFKVEWMEGA